MTDIYKTIDLKHQFHQKK